MRFSSLVFDDKKLRGLDTIDEFERICDQDKEQERDIKQIGRSF